MWSTGRHASETATQSSRGLRRAQLAPAVTRIEVDEGQNQQTYDPLVLDNVLEAYDAAWNQSDAADRARLLARALSDDGELVDPSGRYQGRQAVHDRIAGFNDRFPGARVTITSGIDEHHGFARYAWTVNTADGEAILEGVDIVERAEDSRLRRVVMFFGRLPQAGE